MATEHEPLSIAIFERGPAWIDGRTSREQPWWDEHAVFIDALSGDGRLVLAGPFRDWSGAVVVVRGDVGDAERLFADDPFVVHGVFGAPTVRPWMIWVDARDR